MILLSPKGVVPRWLGLLLLLPLMSPQRSSLKEGEFMLMVLDVGQGLSVILRTQNHTLVYDTGPRFGLNNDAGASIIQPSLKILGSMRIDQLIVSHGDLDHAGGVLSLAKGMAISETIAGEPRLIDSKMAAKSCTEIEPWELDSLRFEFIPTGMRAVKKRNNLSCILLVSIDGFRILLPGDIEALVEKALVKSGIKGINILVAPHHGSLTSSSPAFLNRLMPELVIISAGYLNKFNHPASSVVARYQNRGARVLNTAEMGAVTVSYLDNKVTVTSARQSRRHFWYD